MSRWEETDTYSPRAIDTAPATSAATPATSTAVRSGVAAATPTTRPAVEMIPSLAPSTPARSQFRRALRADGIWSRSACSVASDNTASASAVDGTAHGSGQGTGTGRVGRTADVAMS